MTITRNNDAAGKVQMKRDDNAIVVEKSIPI
jgi:hypothetical protein